MTNRIVNGFKKFLENWNARTPGAIAAAHGAVIQATTLEDRVLYSATPLLDPALAGSDAQSTADTMQSPHDLVDVLSDDATPLPPVQELSNADQTAANPVHHELVFIDARIDEIDQLVNAFLEREDATHDVEIVYLDATQDGFVQVDAALAGDVKYDAIHFVTHGADGMVRLGGSWLDAQTIEQRLDQLQGWSDSLTDDADLIFYGCDFAADEAGQDVVERLSEITGADVAASDDATGTAARGGDWLLEYRTGVIDVQMSFDESLAGWEHLLNTYVVTTTADSGAGSLRTAITNANNNAGTDTISFNIGTGVQTITLSSLLPTINGTTIIDGWTQGGWSSTPLIIIDGNNLTGDGLVFSSTADNSIVRGLIIRDFSANGISIASGANGLTIVGNYIGRLNASGTDSGAADANGSNGIYSQGANATIGGTTMTLRNVISGNNTGIMFDGANATGNKVWGNYIGTDATGNTDLGNTTNGIQINSGATNNTIGTDLDGTGDASEGNLLSGNDDNGIGFWQADSNFVRGNKIGINAAGNATLGNTNQGIWMGGGASSNTIGGSSSLAANVIGGSINWAGITIDGAGTDNNVIQGNFIGTDSTGTADFGNAGPGISLQASSLGTVIGGTNAGEGNVIAFNDYSGIYTDNTTVTSTIRRNSLYSNTGIGIDLNGDGVTLNDLNDADGGGNGGKNFFLPTTMTYDGSQFVLSGTYDGIAAARTYHVELFANSSSTDEAHRYLGYISFTTNSSGDATISNQTLVASLNQGEWVSFITTDTTGAISSEIAAAQFSWQEGTSSYTGTQDTFISSTQASTSYGTQTSTHMDLSDATYGVTQTLLRFDNLFGTGTNQIPLGSVILSARLVVNTTNAAASTTISMHRMLANWTEASTYNSMTGGVTYDNVESLSAADASFTAPTVTGLFTISGLEAAVQSWSNGATNYGWVFATNSTDSWQFSSSEDGTVANRPELIIEYAAPTVGVVVTPTTGLTTTESGGTAQFSVVLTAAPTSNVTIAVASSDTTEGTVSTSLLTFTTANWNIAQTVTVTGVDDQWIDGNIGYTVTLGAMTSTDTRYSGLNPVDVTLTNNDNTETPVQTLPGAQSTNEDNARVFSSGNGNQISLTDYDPTSTTQVTLSVTNGTLTLAGTTGLTFTSGDGTSDATMTFYGSVTNINNALNGLSFSPTTDYNGGATLTLATRDSTLYNLDIDSGLVGRYTFDGNTNDVGPGTAQNGTLVNGATYTTDGTRGQVLSLDGVNDFVSIASTFSNPTNVTIGGWVNLLSGTGRKEFISLDDRMHISLDDTGGVKGSIQTGSGAWLDLNSGQFISGTGWHHVMFTFDDAANTLRLYIDGVQVASTTTTSSIYWTGATTTYIGRHPTATTNFPNALIDDVRIYNRALSADEIKMLANDLSLAASGSVAVTVNAVNDAPTATITPTTYAVNEQATLTLHGTGLSIADIDAASGSVRATLSVVSGTISVSAGSTGATISGSGTNTVTITGTTTQVNNVLAGASSATVTYTMNSDTPPGSDTLTLTANDQGNTGSGGALTASDTATINITALNDAPTATITPTTYAVNEQATLTLHGTGLSIADVDAASSTVKATLSVVSGTISATAGTTGVTITGSGTNTLTLTGTVTQINNLLAGNLSSTLTYTINSDTPPGSDTLTLTANDQGNTGSGGALTATDTATINITALNDAPIAAITPTTYSVNEQATLTLHGTGLSITDVDAASSSVRATLSVVSGTITATAGTTGVTITGSGTSTVTLTGTLTQINNLLAGNLSSTLTYTINSDTPPASDTLTLTANDQGNTGSGGALSASDTATINITALNDAPVATITPTAYGANEQVSVLLSGTGLSITDADAASGTMSVTLAVGEGTLTVAAGSTGATVSNSGTSTVTITGTVTQINNLLAGNSGGSVSYIDNTDTPSASTTLTMTVNDQGNTGSGGALTATDTATINITALNDAPIAAITPTTYAVNEQATLTLHGTGLSITDVDAASSTVQATLTVVSGTITATAGTTGVTVGGSGTNTVTLTGTLTQINNLLAGNLSATLTYTINSDAPPASDTLTLTANDQGNTGSGGALTASDTATINITALNDAPVATITPTAYGVNEQVNVLLSGTGLSIADADAASGTMSVTLAVGEGTLTVAAGSTGATVSNSGTSTVTITGTVTQINNLLAGNSGGSVSYIDNTDTPSASTTLTMTVNDQGNTGSGGALTATDTATINITALNDAPTATITPTTYAVNEQATLTLHGTGLSIADVDAASSTVQATLTVVSGTITATAGTTGVTVGGSGTNTLTLTGTLTQINNLLAGNLSSTLTYTINSDTPPGSDTLTLTANDQGNTGSGGALTGSDTATINITALNDAPIAAITPTTYSVNEQATLTLHGTGLSITDVDAASSTVQATLSVVSGTITATAGTTGVTVGGSGTNTVTLTGTLTQINNLLAGNLSATLTYTINSDTPPASDTLTLTANDQGNTGSGGALTASDTATINITALNDAPVATITPTAYGVNEQVSVLLSGTGLSIADADAASGTMSVTLAVGEGTLTVAAGSTGASVSNSGTSTVTITGTVTQINDLLAGNSGGSVSYIDNTDTPSASTTLTMTVNDQGNTGNGGSLTATDTATINITALNDAPTATITPTTYAVNEQATLTLHGTGLSIADVDAASGTMSVTLSVGEGTLNVTAGTTGASVSNSGTSSVTVTGTIAQINDVLSGNLSSTVTYTDNTDTPGASTTLTMTVNDQGNTGSGGALTGSDTATINLTALNDAPTATITPTTYSVNEQTSLTLHGTGLTIADADAGSGTLSVTLSVGEGTLAVTAGTSGASVTNSGTDTVTITGTVTQINNLLAGNNSATVSYLNSLDNPVASTVLTLAVNDLGNTGSGGALVSNDTATINITSINDAPTTSDVTASAAEDSTSVAITLVGADVDGTVTQFQLSGLPSNGTLYLDAGLTTTVSAGVNYAASGQQLTLYFAPTADWNGVSTFQYFAVDNLGLADASANTATITITAVNDAPVITSNGAGPTAGVSIVENTTAITTVTATDIDLPAQTLTYSIVNTDDGALFAINGAGVLTFIAAPDYENPGDIGGNNVYDVTVQVSDGVTTDTQVISVTVTNGNETPTATITPASYTVNEQATLTLHGTGLSIADSDAGSGTVSVTLSVGEGTLNVSAGLTGASVANSGTSNVTLTGTISQINSLLAGNLLATVTYTDNLDAPSASTTLTLLVNDLGNSGAGGPLTASDTATINIMALNDAPTATITPTTYAVNEQAVLTLHGTGLSIADADAVSGTMSVTLSVGEGTLTVSAGTTGASVSNSGTSSVTITGTVAQINDLLAGNLSGTVTYTDNTDTPSASTTLTLAVNDQGNTGSGGALTASDTATINITALNDAPTATITPTTYSINEQATLTLHGTGLSIADLDAASSTVRATLSVVSGTISAAAGTTGVTVSGSGTNTVTLTGTLTQINNLLAGNLSSTLTYTLNSDTPPGSDTLTLIANDQGNTGSGGALTASDTATINITALNDAPTATITPTTYAVNEQATLTLHGTGLSIADADAVSGTMSVTLSVGEGTLTVSAGTTGATVTNSGTSNVTITGTVTQINNLLAGNLSGTVTYADNTDTPSASTTLTLAVNDQGNTGSGGALTASDTATINITALNDAPTATITPTTYSVNEQATLTLHGTGLTIADVDASSGVMRVTLSVGAGTLNVAAGSTGTTVTGSGTSTVTVTGTVTQINNLLAGNNSGTVDYILNSDTPSASTTLTMTVNDQGNTGTGGALTSTDTATINITALNDAPTATITPTTYAVNEQATLTLHGTGLSIADADAVSGTMSVTLSVGEGTLTVTAGTTGATVTNSGTSNVTITGTVTQINNLLAGNLSGTVTYTDNTNTPSASTTLTLSVNDQGNTGTGGALTASDTATINITALNDAPTATITPTTYSVNEQATLTLHGTGLSIADADGLSGTLQVTLSVGTGTLTVAAGTTGVTVSGSGSSSVSLTGTIGQINDLLAGNNAGTIDYVLNSDTPAASTVLTLAVNDQGNTGSGGALTANDTATINITALNDAPTATITPTTYSVNEQATLTLHGTGLSIADLDAASSSVRATLSVVSGTISAAAGSTGVTVSGSGTNTVTLTGTLTQINNLLAGNLSSTLTYTLNSNTPPGSDTLTLTANDQGNTGSGGALTASDTATINITALNDAPTATITPTTYSVNEQATLTLHGTGLSIADADAVSGTMSVTLSVGEGTLSVSTGSTGATVSNSGTANVTITGTVTQINDLLAGNLSGTVTYTDNTDTPSASTTLTLSVNDQGNTGTGGALTATDTATINITALNDAPIATITPTSYSVNEQTTLTLHGTGLSIADADGLSGTLRITLSVGEGTITVAAGTTGATVTNSGTSSVTITGTITQLNDLLAGNNSASVTYFNSLNNPSASTTLTLAVNDQGNTGAGGALIANDTATITINSDNDEPLTGNATASVSEDTASTSITLTATDSDGTVTHFQLTSLPSVGTLYLDAGLTNAVSTGTNYAATGQALTLYFAPPAQWNGSATFQFVGVDNLGLADSTPATGTITYSAVNDAPVTNTNSVTLAGVNEDTASPPGATVSALFGSAFDDSADQVSGGSSANNLAGIAITANTAVSATQGNWQYYNGSSWVNISTSVSTTSALVLNANTQLRFMANANYNGTPGTLTVRLIDDSAGAVTSGTTVNVTSSGGTTRYSNLANAITLDTSIAAINDAPTATITPTTYTVSEQVTLNLHGTGLAIADVDAASGTMSVTLSVGEGTLNVAAGATGATVVNSGTSTVTLTGTVTQINNLLAGASGATVTYVDSTDTPSASTVLTLAVNDQGNSGSGGALTASDTATINLTAVNDAPTAVITPTVYSVNEQTSLTLHGTGLTIADVDASGAVMRVTLSVGSGTLTVAAGTSGATVSGSGTSTVTLNGTATQLNDLLAGNNGGTIDYLNSSDAPSASTTLTMTVNDLGNTGTGGALTATDTVTINITALNDAPTAAITPASYTVNEQTTLTLDGTGLTIADVDASGAIVTATLSVGEGTLTASAGSTGATVSGSGTNTLVLTGTVTQINNLLNGSGPAFVSYIDNTDAPSASTTLTLTVNDQGNSGAGGALLGSDTATIFINNVNDAPVIINNTFSLLENSSNATLVGLVPVTDPDLGDTHTYSITAGNTSGAFSIDNTGALVVLNVGALDFELLPIFTLTVRVQDAAGAFDTATIIVNLINVNESAVGPVSDTNAATNQVNENSLIGTTVGLTADATDGDTLDLITYSLDDSAGGLFAVNALTGVVTVAGSLDAETAGSHTIIVRATSSDTSYSTQSFTINVRDVSEFPIGAISDVDATVDEVVENSVIGTVVGVTAFADDADVTATVTYSLTNSAGGRFAIDANTGVVTVNGAIDAEAASSYTITVRALSSDGSNTSKSFVINVLDVNESPVSTISDTNVGTNQVSEAAAIGATVGLTAFADDTDVTDTVSYSLDDDAGGLFTIDANTGVVTVAAGLDAETATSHTIIVRATSSDTSSSTRSFTINILDVNEVPLGPLSDANGAVNEVAENAANGTVVGITALAVDGDVTATVTYSLTNSAGGRFAINASTGVVTVAGALDAEASTSYTITVLATSSDTSTSTQSFTINLLDVNEFPTTAISDTNVATNQVAENVALGTMVGITAQASDGDVTDTIGYSLDDDAGGLFTIDANTGVVTVAGAIDAETATSLTIIVRATSSDTSFTVRSFSINILDVNEFATTPVIDSDSAVDEVTENSAIGTVVGVTGLASDGDVTDTIAYSLDDDAGGLFTIDANTGVITVAGAIDYETAHSYTVIVRATSSDTSFAIQSFTINVLDVNDNPPTLDLDGDDSSGATGLDFVTTFTEDAGPVLIGDFDLTINDPDSPIINSVVITITNRLDGAAELLAADTTGTSITAAYVNGVLTLSGADSLAHYQQVLQTVSYVNLSDDANLTDRVITFISSDGTLTGPTATATIHLVGMADAPTLTSPGLVNAVEDTPLVLSAATTGTALLADVDSATLEMTISVLSGNVTLATTAGLTFLTGDGLHDTTLTFTGTQAALNAALDGIQFTPDTDFNGLASVTWTVRDPDNLTATGTTSIDVSAVNDAPVITGVTTVQTDEDTPVVFGAAHGNAFQVVDVDAGIVSVTLSAGNGALTLASVQGLTFVVGDGLADDTLTFTGSVSDVNTALDGLQFTPAADYHGAATIQVNVDDQGNTGTGGVLSDSLTTLLQINSVNDAPVGVDDRIETRNIDTIVISTAGFLLNDTDVDGDTLTATLLTRPTHGTLVESGGGAWLYVPDVTFFGDDTFTYITSDGQTTSQPITVTIAISIAGGPNSGGGASNAAAVSGIVSGALITSASKEESTSVVNTQTTTTTVLPVTREVVNEAPGGPLQNNANSMPTVIEIRTLDTDSQASANFRSALIVRSETNSRASDSSIARLLSPLTTYTPFNVGTMHTMLDGLRDQVEMRWESMHVSTGSVAVTAVGLTAGYALWALRGAHLVATLLTTMPAWWSIDPLPILTATQAMKMRDDDHEETLADIAGGSKKKSPQS